MLSQAELTSAINALYAEIDRLNAEVAAQQKPAPAPTPTPAPAPTPTPAPAPAASTQTLLKGWSAVDIARAEKFAGVPQATRGPFYSALPAAYDPKAARFHPKATHRFISFSHVTKTLETYCKSVPADVTAHLIYVHEVENGKSGTYEGTTTDYTGKGAAYVADYVKAYDRVKAANPKVQMGMVSASWAYRPNQADKTILAGAFLPPANKVDFYGVDTYQEGTTNLQPLSAHPKFQNWFKLVKGRGKPLAIIEYGLELLTVVSQNPFSTKEQAAGESAARAKTVTADYAWLKSTGLFSYWLYWYYSHSTAGDPTAPTREFTDQGSIDAWAAVGR